MVLLTPLPPSPPEHGYVRYGETSESASLHTRMRETKDDQGVEEIKTKTKSLAKPRPASQTAQSAHDTLVGVRKPLPG